jgi:hypothetical protein
MRGQCGQCGVRRFSSEEDCPLGELRREGN